MNRASITKVARDLGWTWAQTYSSFYPNGDLRVKLYFFWTQGKGTISSLAKEILKAHPGLVQLDVYDVRSTSLAFRIPKALLTAPAAKQPKVKSKLPKAPALTAKQLAKAKVVQDTDGQYYIVDNITGACVGLSVAGFPGVQYKQIRRTYGWKAYTLKEVKA